MSLIRCLSNPEGLHAGTTKSDRTGKTVVFIAYKPSENQSVNSELVECSPRDFGRLCRDWVRNGNLYHRDPPIRSGGLLLRGTPQDRLELVIRQGRKPSVSILLWKVTWEYIVRNWFEYYAPRRKVVHG